MGQLGDADYVPDTAFLSFPAAKTFHLEFIIQLVVIFIASILYAISMNMFFIPHNMISGGFAGVGMIIGYLMHYNIGALLFTKHSSSYFKSLLLRQEDNLFNSVLCSCIIVSDEHYPCTPSFRRYFTVLCIRRCNLRSSLRNHIPICFFNRWI